MNTLRYALSTAFVVILSSGLIKPALAGPYKVETLARIQDEGTSASKINAKGEVAGKSAFGEDFSRSVYWNANGQFTNLTLGDPRFANTGGISDAGTVVYSEFDRFYAWNAGTVTDLGIGSAGAVNGRGQIAGTFAGVFGIWTDGTVSPLPLLSPGATGIAYDINNNSEVVGLTYFPDSQSYRAAVWRNGGIEQIGTLPGDISSFPQAINDAGQVVGYSINSARKWRAFLWENGVIRDLGIPNDPQSFALGFNNAGQVVGGFQSTIPSNNSPFIWQNGVLNDLSPVLSAGNCSIYDINDAGQMIANCVNFNTASGGIYRLTPVALAGDLSVNLRATPVPATVGVPLVYTTTVTNIGNATTTNAQLTQTMPASGFTVESVLSSLGSCIGTNVVTCEFGDLAGGASAVVTIVATPLSIPGTSAYYSSSVVATTSTPEVNTVNNSAKIEFTVTQNNAALRVDSINSQTAATKGGNITYTWRVSNGGPMGAKSVKLTDTLPSGLSLVSVKTTAGTCTGTVTISCSLGDLNFSNVTVTIVAKANVRGTITNRATVTSTTPDSYLGDNTATVSTRVR